jgi:NAD(P)-dependent dehydrogenase (short-subunit alcohol dehydrogenase family)
MGGPTDDKRMIEGSLGNIPVAPRFGQPDEVAYAVGILCEERAGWMNGNHIHVNGGLLLA